MIFPSSLGSAPLINLPKSILACLGLLSSLLPLRAAVKWEPIDAAEWAQTKSSIDPEAGAEVILDDTTFDGQSAESSEVIHRVRVRIYEQRGVEKYSKVEIPFLKGASIRRIEARTVAPDGGVSLLDPKDIYDREVLRAGNVRVKVKSFAPPGIVPNCIVEYRYTQESDTGIYRVVMPFSREVPARCVHYRVRMDGYDASNLACLSFSCPPQQLKSEKGYYNFEMRNLPAEKEEAFSPPAINIQPVVVVYLMADKPSTQKEYLKKRASNLQDYLDKEAGDSRAVRNTLSSLVAPTDDLETKLQKIYEYCRTKIINRSRESAELTTEQKKKLKDNENASDTLKQGNGTSYDINLVFAALVRAAGAQPRLVLCNDRDFVFYSPKVSAPFMLTDVIVALPATGGWRYFDPGSTYLPFGEVNWFNSDTISLLSSAKDAETVEIAGVPVESSSRSRVGQFNLDTDGTLDGTVVTTYTGLFAAEIRDDLDRQTAGEREKTIRERLQTTLKLAEVSELTIENINEVQADLKISYHLRVPEYAERTGSRMFFQPAVFQKNLQPTFDSATRTHSIVFHYRNIEHDEMTIQPPPGFSLEAGSNPGAIDMGDFASYATQISYSKKSGKIKYDRKFALKSLLVPPAGYAGLKAGYDQIHTKDNHVLTLKQSANPSNSSEDKVNNGMPASPSVPVVSTSATAAEQPSSK